MSTGIISSLSFIGQQITIYVGILTIIAGVVGGCLIIIVFLSLRTFRQSSCAFYLTIMSIVNIGQLFTGLLTRIMISGFDIDWTQIHYFIVNFDYIAFQICALMSYDMYMFGNN